MVKHDIVQKLVKSLGETLANKKIDNTKILAQGNKMMLVCLKDRNNYDD